MVVFQLICKLALELWSFGLRKLVLPLSDLFDPNFAVDNKPYTTFKARLSKRKVNRKIIIHNALIMCLCFLQFNLLFFTELLGTVPLS